MAYERKYSTTYCDVYGNICQVFILERDYTGGVITELKALTTPFTLTYESTSDFKFDPIRSSFGTVNFLLHDNQNLDELLTADERKYKLEHYIDNVLDWVGFVLPNGYSYNFTGGYYEASVEATDGLTALDSYSFLDDSTGLPYGTRDLIFNDGFLFPFILIATEILRKLELDIDLWTCVDVYEASMDKTGDREADPLANAYVNVKSYIGDSDRKDRPYWREAGEVFNCREVMENLLNIFSAKLYQSEGTWRIKRVNVDANYGTGDTQRYWRKYNTLSAYIGKEIVNKELTIPCHSIPQAFIENDHVLSSDDAYKSFRVNYDYTFVRDGDTPVSLMDNGNFEDWNYDNKLSAPTNWERKKFDLTDPFFNRPGRFLKINKVDVTTLERPFIEDGHTVAMEFMKQKEGFEDNSLSSGSIIESKIVYDPIPVKKGDELRIKMWIKTVAAQATPLYSRLLQPTFQIALMPTANFDADIRKEALYTLQNNFTNELERGTENVSWFKHRNNGQDYVLTTFKGEVDSESPSIITDLLYLWRKVEVFVPALPEDGFISFEMLGLTTDRGLAQEKTGTFTVNKLNGNNPPSQGLYGNDSVDFVLDSSPNDLLRITGVEVGFIPDENSYAELTDYIYDNPKPNYTLQVDPIEVYNGDTFTDTHVSTIIVPSNVSGKKNFWDTISDDYGKSSIGLISAKSIMNLYFCPLLTLEGTIKTPNVTFDTRYEFEALPGKKWIMQRGTFFRKLGYVEDATFVEISDEVLPPGGTEGVNTLDPVWVFTGETRCQKDENNLNTSNLEGQERDTNANSETYLDIRWTVIEENSDRCPLGEPTRFFYGTQPQSFVLSDFNTSDLPLTGSLRVSLNYDNIGGDYIYLIHLASIGIVESVTTTGQPEVISDFQYFADIVDNGFTYRVYRQEYVTSQFSNFAITYKFTI